MKINTRKDYIRNSCTKVDVCVVGHITRDIIKIGNRVKELPGGTAYYTSVALKNLGVNVAVVTKLNYSDRYLLDELTKNNIPIFLNKSPKTTIFENIYLDGYSPPGKDRLQKVRAVATPIRVDELRDISSVIFHIGSLTKGDVSPEALKFLSKKSIISLDVQGFLREVVEGCVKMRDWEEKKEILPYVDILKANAIEAKILTGKEDIKEAAKTLSSLGVREVIITLGEKGSLIYSKKRFYFIPSYPQPKVVDPTGCGDTYMAGYIYKRLESIHSVPDFDKTGKFAAIVASLKLGKYGPFKKNASEIEPLLQKKEKSHESFDNRCWKR